MPRKSYYKEKPLPTEQRKRVCAAEGCITVLSRYNLGRYCNACDAPTDDRMPQRRP